jgi:hypothetical protein
MLEATGESLSLDSASVELGSVMEESVNSRGEVSGDEEGFSRKGVALLVPLRIVAAQDEDGRTSRPVRGLNITI